MRQIASLTLLDFDRHPVWVHCHIVDYDEPWYEDTDKETFRPWYGEMPIEPSGVTYLVQADFRLAGGTTFRGYITPAERENFGTMQPTIVVESGRHLNFWYGFRSSSQQEREAVYRTLGTVPATTFPIFFAAKPGPAGGITSGQLLGFYSFTGWDQPPRIER